MKLIGEKLPTLKKQKVNIYQRGNEGIFPNLHQQVQIFCKGWPEDFHTPSPYAEIFTRESKKSREKHRSFQQEKIRSRKNKKYLCRLWVIVQRHWHVVPNSSLHHIFVRCPPQSVGLREDCGTKWQCLGALNNHSFIWHVHGHKSGKEVKPTLFTE